MSALPPALRPWAPQLSVFPDDLALHLGPYVARLSAALGALRPRGESDGGEPQGYDGLIRRGPFDRLLVSDIAGATLTATGTAKPFSDDPTGSFDVTLLSDDMSDFLGVMAKQFPQMRLFRMLSDRAVQYPGLFTESQLDVFGAAAPRAAECFGRRSVRERRCGRGFVACGAGRGRGWPSDEDSGGMRIGICRYNGERAAPSRRAPPGLVGPPATR